jgi:hypothetical protein
MSEQQIDYSYDQIGKRLSGEGLTEHERILAEDDKVRVQWVLEHVKALDDNECHSPILVVDIGASDATIGRRIFDATGFRLAGIEPHPAHRDAMVRAAADGVYAWVSFVPAEDALFGLPMSDIDNQVAILAGEVFEHLDDAQLDNLMVSVNSHWMLVVTVPNRNSVSYDAQARSRWNWPDHKQHFTASGLGAFLKKHGWTRFNERVGIQPIVGTLDDSVWLGAVCVRA